MSLTVVMNIPKINNPERFPGKRENTSASLPALQPRSHTLLKDIAQLIKFRLTLLVLTTTFFGFVLGASGPLDLVKAIHVLVGTALLAASAAVLNEVLESRQDSQMSRTKDRPLPAHRFDAIEAAIIAIIGAVIGFLYLWNFSNLVAAFIALFSLVSYVCIYTPLKRISPWNTWIGAVSGALPPVIGYAAQNENLVHSTPLFLFSILFFWQMPHFYAIAWIYKNDYKKAGFKMLVVVDSTGKKLTSQSLLFSFLLLPISTIPYFTGHAGVVYLGGSLALGLVFLGSAFLLHLHRDLKSARLLFFSSIAYLPLLFTLLALCWKNNT
ncbi:Heme O synthase, protoheme IX farnesyltransferase CtaB [Methylacidiphilum infernorum V4]|uniref:Protoheme IX farnesyltransferase n=2 Tax=Candidatus Methylacidiphilum infernorum TaxID=511746 RepID=B3DVX8_METI4|nr:Heme O synthase, protoheme IX farnesyltransferase CtaB [Methylacidiphilum infernorum V4]